MYDRAYQKNLLREKAAPVPKPKRRFRRFVFISITLILLAGILILLRSAGMQVREITIAGTIVTDPMEVEDFIKTKLEGKYLWVIPKTNIIFLPVEKLEHALSEQFTRLSSVEINRSNLHRVSVSVTEYEGTYLWCRPGGESEACFFMDPIGTVFAPAPFFSGSAYLRLYGGTDAEQLPFTPVSTEALETVEAYVAGLPEVRITPTTFTFESAYKLVIGFSFRNQPTMLIVDPHHAPEAILENLALALNVEPLKSQFRSETKKLLYIDARSSNLNEVFYKFE